MTKDSKEYQIEEYDYPLDTKLIAQTPLKKRDSARLLVIHNNKSDKKADYSLEHKKFKNIAEYFSAGDVLVVNETKVAPAAIRGKKSTGAVCEIIILGKAGKNNSEESSNNYLCKVKATNPRVGNNLEFPHGLTAEIVGQTEDDFTLRFNKKAEEVEEYMHKYGKLPIPYYIKKEVKDYSLYQTVFASEEKKGSIAAPTAALHFTSKLMGELRKKGVKIVALNLKLGFESFKPVRCSDVREHKMHGEYYEVPEETALAINQRKGRLFVVGTTSLRVLETAADNDGQVKAGTGLSQIYIYPGCKFKNKIDGFITNFHLPKTTMFILVAAMVGTERLKEVYAIAQREKYRLYSFGDGMMVLNENSPSEKN